MDDASEFRRKARAMFGRVREYHFELAFRFVVGITQRLVTETRGIDNFKPLTTEYQHTGRLRGGYSYSTTKLENASKWDDGPFSYYGEETVMRIEADMRAAGVKSFYIVNDVGYAWLVWKGRGRHIAVGADDWLGRVAAPPTQANALEEALRSMGAA